MIILIEETFGKEVSGLLAEHLQELSADSSPESMHGLSREELVQPEVTFWCAWQDVPSADVLSSETLPTVTAGCRRLVEPTGLMGFAAIKQLTSTHAELKSMRTSQKYLRQGVAAALLDEIWRVAVVVRGYQRISLETGTLPLYEPAIALYKRFGFEFCGPFANYSEDPESCYMSCLLPPRSEMRGVIPRV